MSCSDPTDSPNDNAETSASGDEIHTGYDLELGLLARAREWTDLLPWLRLIRVLRVAGSPPLIFLVSITFAIWQFGNANFFDSPVSFNLTDPRADNVREGIESMGVIPGLVQLMIPSEVLRLDHHGPGRRGQWWYGMAAILWTMLIWIPVVLLLLRQGALLTAGRPLVGFSDGLRHALRRTPYAALMAAVPLLCVLCMCIALLSLGWVSRLHVWIAGAVSLGVTLIAIVCGLLAFGANIAVPFGWASMVNEKEADPLDSLSRGYEYIYRRPLHLALYTIVCIAVLTVATSIAAGIAGAANQIAAASLRVSGANPQTFALSQELLAYLPLVVASTVFWSLVGGVYLLMRHDAGGQEVEDIWIPPMPSPPSIPTLPTRSSE